MKRILPLGILIVLLVALTAGCPAPAPEENVAGEEAAVAETAPLPEQVQKAVDVAKALEADPDRVAAILEEVVMTPEEYEALLFDIAADPELSRLYNEAMGY
jgi:hypothetical protein